MKRSGGYNRSVDFLEMIKNTSTGDSHNKTTKNTVTGNNFLSKINSTLENDTKPKNDIKARNSVKPEVSIKSETGIKNKFGVKQAKIPAQVGEKKRIVVIDTETNWNDEVMSIGLAVADTDTFKCIDSRYYIIEPESLVGGMFSGVMHKTGGVREIVVSRREAMADIRDYLREQGIDSIFAYNARFDKGHLAELSEFEWFDIMRIAAYKQYNVGIPANAECCKTGRLKRGYGVEDILRMIGDDIRYQEVHNAVMDAVDELMIMELLGHPLEIYDVARI